MNWRITASCLLLSLALHALLFQLFNDTSYLSFPDRQVFRVDRLRPAREPLPLAGQAHPAVDPEPRTTMPPVVAPATPAAATAPEPLSTPPVRAAVPAPLPVPPPEQQAPAAATPRHFTSDMVFLPEHAPVPPTSAVPTARNSAAVREAPLTSGAGGAQSASQVTVAPMEPPAYLQTPKPAYPRLAKARRWEGTVLLKVFIDERGLVDRAEISRSSGHKVLDQAALQQIKDWRFRPARRGGVTIASEALVPIDFILEGS